jgi:hypothetical protein
LAARLFVSDEQRVCVLDAASGAFLATFSETKPGPLCYIEGALWVGSDQRPGIAIYSTKEHPNDFYKLLSFGSSKDDVVMNVHELGGFKYKLSQNLLMKRKAEQSHRFVTDIRYIDGKIFVSHGLNTLSIYSFV